MENISENYIREIFLNNGEKIKYKIGQSLSSDSYISGVVNYIESGEARIIFKENKRLRTLDKISVGEVVGAISLIRGTPCENVRASSELVAISISDRKFKDIFEKDEKFRTFFIYQKNKAEIIEFSQSILDLIPNSEYSTLEIYNLIFKNVVYFSENSENTKDFFKEDNVNFISTFLNKESNFKRLEKYENFLLIKEIKSLYPKRFLVLKKELIESFSKSIFSNTKNDKEKESNKSNFEKKIQYAPKNAPLSIFNNIDFEKNNLITATGQLRETLACFEMLGKILDFPIRKDSIEKKLRDLENRGCKINLQIFGEFLFSLGLSATKGAVPTKMAFRLQTPSLIKWKESFALVVKSSQEGIVLASPSDGLIQINIDEIKDFLGEKFEILLIEKTKETPSIKFNLNWFLPVIKKYRFVLIQVLLASFVIQLFTLGNPLLIQVIIDKVISQRSLDALQVLGIALLFVTLLEGILGSLKTFLFAETTNRIDQTLGAKVIDHLLRLPLSYFDKRPVGELGSRIDELETIREFLTGQALSTILDAIFSLIYILVMFLYSSLLTLVALIVVPVQILITILGGPLFRKQFRQTAEQNAKTKSHLVEILTSIQTVKSQNIETISRWKWQELYSKYIARNFEKIISGTILIQTGQILQKLSQLLVLWVGATLVLDGQLTLGQLIAFRIISGYVTQPLLRLSTIWQNIQQLKVSFERLGDVIDMPQESDAIDQSKIPLPVVKGDIEFQGVNFSFTKSNTNILNDVSFKIEKGQFVGIVGESGSGKSTLMKLLSRLYSPNSGVVKIDNFDIEKVELYSLRKQIGIVPQEPILFSGSVKDNISLTNSDSNDQDIVKAAKLAEAHDFIMSLPSGYSTPVGERGSSLSGGQRQRIAIARTLLNNPNLLILDEATSALDYNTENKLCNNLISELSDKTVFFITHRLSSIKNADCIIMMNKGRIDEVGTHEELINLQGRYYALISKQGKF
tara:strand:- start:3066 stop:5984 length:2919 start_codon:yes stop_codon:yes gene_type:complete